MDNGNLIKEAMRTVDYCKRMDAIQRKEFMNNDEPPWMLVFVLLALGIGFWLMSFISVW